MPRKTPARPRGAAAPISIGYVRARKTARNKQAHLPDAVCVTLDGLRQTKTLDTGALDLCGWSGTPGESECWPRVRLERYLDRIRRDWASLFGKFWTLEIVPHEGPT